jgi:hypothetical protein
VSPFLGIGRGCISADELSTRREASASQDKPPTALAIVGLAAHAVAKSMSSLNIFTARRIQVNNLTIELTAATAYLPCHNGIRFSAKAFRPSSAS